MTYNVITDWWTAVTAKQNKAVICRCQTCKHCGCGGLVWAKLPAPNKWGWAFQLVDSEGKQHECQ